MWLHHNQINKKASKFIIEAFLWFYFEPYFDFITSSILKPTFTVSRESATATIKVAKIVNADIFTPYYTAVLTTAELSLKLLALIDLRISGPTFVTEPAPIVNTTSPGSMILSK